MASSYRNRVLAFILIALMLFLSFEVLSCHHCSDLYCPICQALSQRRILLIALPVLIFGVLTAVGFVATVHLQPVSLSTSLVHEKVKITS